MADANGAGLCRFGPGGEFAWDYTPGPGLVGGPARAPGVTIKKGCEFRLEVKHGRFGRWRPVQRELSRYRAERMAENGAIHTGAAYAVVCEDPALPFDQRVEFRAGRVGVERKVVIGPASAASPLPGLLA